MRIFKKAGTKVPCARGRVLRRRLFAAAAMAIALPAFGAAPQQPDAQLSLWRLDCGEMLVKQYGASYSDTFAYPAGEKRLVDSCYLVRHGDRYLLWDTGFPGEFVGKQVDTPMAVISLRERLVPQLAQIGVTPAQIDTVGISHQHLDHIGQAADFPNARLVIGVADLAALRTERGPLVQPTRLKPWIEGGGKLVETVGDFDIFGDGQVVMLATPGHTHGHHSLLVRLASGPVILTGDLYHFEAQVQNRGVPPGNADRADTLASMDRISAIKRNLRAKIIIQHDPADVAKLPQFPAAAR